LEKYCKEEVEQSPLPSAQAVAEFIAENISSRSSPRPPHPNPASGAKGAGGNEGLRSVLLEID